MWYQVTVTNCREVLEDQIFSNKESASEFYNSDLIKEYPTADHVEMKEVEVIHARPFNREKSK